MAVPALQPARSARARARAADRRRNEEGNFSERACERAWLTREEVASDALGPLTPHRTTITLVVSPSSFGPGRRGHSTTNTSSLCYQSCRRGS